MTKKKKKSGYFGRIFLLLLGLVFGLLLVGYLGIALYYTEHYLPNTTIGNTDCSNKTPAYAVSRTSAVVESYLLTIYDRDGNKFFLKGPEFQYSYVNKGEEERILDSQNNFSWPLAFWNTYTYELNTSVAFDSSLLEASLKELECFSSEDFIIAPQSASLVLGKDGYKIIPEIYGNTLIYDKVFALVLDAVEHQITSLTLSDEYYEQPDILSEDASITDLTDQIDSFLQATITYEIEGATEGLSSSDIYHMLSIDEDNHVSIMEDKITQYVQKLASTYNTYADRRTFTTSLGDDITIGGGDYGWVINKKAEAAQLLEDLNGGIPVHREPVYEQTAWAPGPNDIGDTYVEVDYTNQHLWYYCDGKLVIESDFVSGNLEKGNGSPDGVFKIVYKQKDATLVGETYESSVDYFLPFAYNVGFHDASWRSKFGGDIFRTKGSHGCINLPFEAAETLYHELKVGTPVVAFYREEIMLTSDNAYISNAYSYVDPATIIPEEPVIDEASEGTDNNTSEDTNEGTTT